MLAQRDANAKTLIANAQTISKSTAGEQQRRCAFVLEQLRM
jgi:hypothetical protein